MEMQNPFPARPRWKLGSCSLASIAYFFSSSQVTVFQNTCQVRAAQHRYGFQERERIPSHHPPTFHQGRQFHFSESRCPQASNLISGKPQCTRAQVLKYNRSKTIQVILQMEDEATTCSAEHQHQTPNLRTDKGHAGCVPASCISVHRGPRNTPFSLFFGNKTLIVPGWRLTQTSLTQFRLIQQISMPTNIYTYKYAHLYL